MALSWVQRPPHSDRWWSARGQKYGKWGRKDLAGAFVGIDIVCDYLAQLDGKFLMLVIGRCHVKHHAVDQLGTLAIWKGIDIINSVGMFFC